MNTIPSNALELLPERWAVKVDKDHPKWKEWSEWYIANLYTFIFFNDYYAIGENCVKDIDFKCHILSVSEFKQNKSLCPIWTLDEFYSYFETDLAKQLHNCYDTPKVMKEARQYTSEFIEELTKDIEARPMVTLTKEYESAYVLVESENASARIDISINWEKKTFQLSTPHDDMVDFEKLDIEEAELLIVAQQRAIDYVKERFKQEGE